VFTTPDPERVDGAVRATMPLFTQGRVIEGLAVRFERGRAVGIDADSGAEMLRTLITRDEGAARLGELALVDREGRIGRLETVFQNTLLDENAASHLAFGNAYAISVAAEDLDRINRSRIHIDFMIGSDDVSVTGLTAPVERRLAVHRLPLREATRPYFADARLAQLGDERLPGREPCQVDLQDRREVAVQPVAVHVGRVERGHDEAPLGPQDAPDLRE